MPTDVSEAAVSGSTSPLGAVSIEAAILQEGSGTAVSRQAGGTQLHG